MADRRACETFGFFAVTNHGVDPAVVDGAWEASRAFFDCDDAVKGSVGMSADYPYGYESHESLGVARSVSAAEQHVVKQQPSVPGPDSKETFSIGPVDSSKSGMPSRKFPSNAPPAFAPSLTEYFNVMENLARILFRGLALALKMDDVSWFLRDGCFDDGHQCALRILNYPRLEYNEDGSERVHIRAGAHTDYGAMTILKSGGPGLQLKLSSEGDGGDSLSWIDVPHLSDAFIINLGDLMQRWTNDRWRSTLHRVIAVADDHGHNEHDNHPTVFQSARRQSIAFFVNMNGNTTIVPFDTCVDRNCPPRYDAIKASDHLIQRHQQSMGNVDNDP
jgi:isopenicillin N synthase-like dioxygenase